MVRRLRLRQLQEAISSRWPELVSAFCYSDGAQLKALAKDRYQHCFREHLRSVSGVRSQHSRFSSQPSQHTKPFSLRANAALCCGGTEAPADRISVIRNLRGALQMRLRLRPRVSSYVKPVADFIGCVCARWLGVRFRWRSLKRGSAFPVRRPQKLVENLAAVKLERLLEL
jgi:hypothetical protein